MDPVLRSVNPSRTVKPKTFHNDPMISVVNATDCIITAYMPTQTMIRNPWNPSAQRLLK
jgi:hypothetical protein